jgi:methionyl-tRNA synthetase
MSNERRFYLTTAIPYVNGDPHLGHALEFVQADVLARHRRLRGDAVRFLRGTDDNALKNALAADAVGVPVAHFVSAKARRFIELGGPLQLSDDDFIRTSADPRHRPGVERLWRACAAAGDLYERDYEGRYCNGCEAFVLDDELVDARCPEHGAIPERVVERNWFFRLSHYADALHAAIGSGRLRIEPEHRRNEVLAFIAAGLTDFSVSRPAIRARGWGIPVPDDPEQVVYVWFDALANYVTALGYGTGERAYSDWWRDGDERLHVVGKGILRFHAVYWPAILLSAGEPLPTTIFVHDYVTVEGRKIGKSLDPVRVVEHYGADALRWWFLRDVPRAGDADFRAVSIAARANELADGLGNLVNRTIALASRSQVEHAGAIAAAVAEPRFRARCDGLPRTIDETLGAFDFRAATAALWDVVTDANRFVTATRPWELASAARDGDPRAAERFGTVLRALLDACGLISTELSPFLPAASERIARALADRDVRQGRALFRKLDAVA